MKDNGEGVMTRVVHVNDCVPGAVYIGRANGRKRLKGSRFANPFNISRTYAITLFEQYLTTTPEIWSLIPDLRGKPLACWCRHDGAERTGENACHGDVLVDLLAYYTDAELRAVSQP